MGVLQKPVPLNFLAWCCCAYSISAFLGHVRNNLLGMVWGPALKAFKSNMLLGISHTCVFGRRCKSKWDAGALASHIDRTCMKHEVCWHELCFSNSIYNYSSLTLPIWSVAVRDLFCMFDASWGASGGDLAGVALGCKMLFTYAYICDMLGVPR